MQDTRQRDLVADLTASATRSRRQARCKAESKDAMKKRGLKSPDLADALCLTMASDAITALSGKSSQWGQPLRRNLRGIA